MDDQIYIYLFLLIVVILAIVSFIIIIKYIQRKGKDLYFDYEDKGIFINGLNEPLTDNAPYTGDNNLQGSTDLVQSNVTNPIASALKIMGSISIVLSLILIVISAFLLTEHEVRLIIVIPVMLSLMLSGIICIRLAELIKLLSRIEQNTKEIRKDKTPNYSERIKAAEICQKNLFDRLKLYEGMDELNYNDYKTSLRGYLELLKATADLYLKMGEYYAAMGDKQKAKTIYWHIIINYTEDVFKSYVINAEFALKDLEET